MSTIKCVLVGDGSACKKEMLESYITRKFSPNGSTIFNSYEVKIMIGNEPHTLVLFDTTGSEDYDRLRHLDYVETDVFLVCFSVENPASLENVENKWVPEITRFCKNVPFLIVGTKIDLRDDISVIERLAERKLHPVTKEEGEKMARKLKAVKYMECSALTMKGLDDVFNEAILATLEPQKSSDEKEKKQKCAIM